MKLCNSIKIFLTKAIYFLLIPASIGCTSGTIPVKPQINRTTQASPVDDYNKLHCIELMSSSDALVQSIRTMKVVFTNTDEIESLSIKELALWNKEIQKTLLQKGIGIINEDTSVNLFEENKSQNSHPSLLIDALHVEKISESKAIPYGISGSSISYTYYYYIAEISGCISIHNSIIWRGNVCITSFDLLQDKKLLSYPEMIITTQTNYEYSQKMQKWLTTNPEITLSDNFSKYFDNDINSNLHKQQLISLAVATLLSPIKGAQ